ncbi:50S ribosomal protein L5 [Candidatus Similichlamydia laticola]|uniref:Large ribosomal subunit protein uL5 n=1 Tax=Candidatus Similichlamydia laticola TaxID=2170265 RepID=A0A369KD55_9BACT|nr:50S ribosomal protein L5 [Candidatus Similichlamydia laticola]RDB31390.1 LSU ribosomal protein L5p (L11e) [Candidatus Similichlamydia laticola]
MSEPKKEPENELEKRYREQVRPALLERFQYSNVMQVPRLVKVVINMGVAKVGKDRGALQDSENELKALSGQKPILIRSKRSVASFKMRQGQPVSVLVTLRKRKMWDFLYRFVNICCPRIRDFRGFRKSGDKMGNYTLGVQDQQIFVEVDLDAVRRQQGMHITFVTSAKSDAECLELLSALGMPFQMRD